MSSTYQHVKTPHTPTQWSTDISARHQHVVSTADINTVHTHINTSQRNYEHHGRSKRSTTRESTPQSPHLDIPTNKSISTYPTHSHRHVKHIECYGLCWGMCVKVFKLISVQWWILWKVSHERMVRKYVLGDFWFIFRATISELIFSKIIAI